MKLKELKVNEQKKTNDSIYHSENYIQIQKLNCILKIIFNYDELTPGLKKSRHFIRLKQNGALEFAVRPGVGKILYLTRHCRLFYYRVWKAYAIVNREICYYYSAKYLKTMFFKFFNFPIFQKFQYFAIFLKNIFTVRDSHSYFFYENTVLHFWLEKI